MPTWTDNHFNRYRTGGAVFVPVTGCNGRSVSAFRNTPQIPSNLTVFSYQATNGYLPGKVDLGLARRCGVGIEFHLVFGQLTIE
jgi:hypothetical protein